MIVCHCLGLTDRAIRRLAREGASSPGDVGLACEAGRCCGGCRPLVEQIVQLVTIEREQSERPRLELASAL